MEPNWTRAIQSSTICNFFYAFFVIYAVIAVVSVVVFLGTIVFVDMPKGMLLSQGFYGLIMISLSTTMALFNYLVCTRALGA